MKKVLTFGLLTLLSCACVLTAFADDKKEKDYTDFGNKKTGTVATIGQHGTMNGLWVFGGETHSQAGLIADPNGSRLLFTADDRKGKGDPVTLGIGVDEKGRPYIWFRDKEGNVKAVDFDRLPIRGEDDKKEKAYFTGTIKKD